MRTFLVFVRIVVGLAGTVLEIVTLIRVGDTYGGWLAVGAFLSFVGWFIAPFFVSTWPWVVALMAFWFWTMYWYGWWLDRRDLRRWEVGP